MGFFRKKDEDEDDIREPEVWFCPVCGMSGTAADGQGQMAADLHMMLAHPPDKNDK
jgi:hypothetical protein